MGSHLENGVANFYSILSELIPHRADIVFFDHAIYGNVGDLMISYATERLLMSYRPRRLLAYSREDPWRAERQINENTILVFQGGGNLGNLFPRHNKVRENLIRKFPRNRCIILPQTIYYRDMASVEVTANVFSRCSDLHIFLRDLTSKSFAERHFDAETYAAPDTAHCFGTFWHAEEAGEGDLHIIREDQAEYGLLDRFPIDLPPDVETMDWPQFLTPSEKATIRRGKRLAKYGREIAGFQPHLWLWRRDRNRILRRAMRLVQAHERIVTNRLHGVIFALLAGRKVVIGDTGYGKLTAYYENWLQDHPDVENVGPPLHQQCAATESRHINS